MVNQFTTRDFTCETDVIDRLFNNIRTAEDEFFICGLPETLLDTALLYQPQVSLRRRKQAPGVGSFPSWSWAGWVGRAWYPWYLNPMTSTQKSPHRNLDPGRASRPRR